MEVETRELRTRRRGRGIPEARKADRRGEPAREQMEDAAMAGSPRLNTVPRTNAQELRSVAHVFDRIRSGDCQGVPVELARGVASTSGDALTAENLCYLVQAGRVDLEQVL